MTRKPTFRWTCSYQGSVWFEVTDDMGRYEVQFRASLPDYERASLNGGEAYAAQLERTIGYLHRSGAPVPAETVRAFNAWQSAEASAWVAKLEANPERYGPVSAEDRAPRYVAKGCCYWSFDRPSPGFKASMAEVEAAGSWKFEPIAAPRAIAA